MSITDKRKQLEAIISYNKDDRGRTIITGLITDFIEWHEAEISKITIHDLIKVKEGYCGCGLLLKTCSGCIDKYGANEPNR